MFQPGDQVDGYEIVAKLKAGGMATLFLGRRIGVAGFAKHVAIKVVHEHLADDPAFVKMFVDEALLSARIEHPNVVHVEELEELNGRYYLVMEYIRGVSLWQLLASLAKRGRRMNEEVAVYIVVEIANGLHSAHETRGERGEMLEVVHRDVSPQNVLLSYQGNVKLIDFGVAKARGRIQDETSGGSIKGKFRYMSPEQAWGRPVDRRSDIYSLGTVLWETLTMRRRFEGKEDAMILDLVRDPELVLPSRWAEGISAELDAVVMKALAVRPEDRFQTAREFRAALLTAIPGAAVLHESLLGSLLRQVMADHIEKEAERLPASVTGLTHQHESGSAPSDQAIHTMTISAVDVALTEEQTDTSGPEAASPPAPGNGTPIQTPRDPAATPATPAMAPIVVPPPRSNALFFAAITAGMLAAGLFGVVVVLGLHLSDEPTPSTVPRPAPAGTSASQVAPLYSPEVPDDAAGEPAGEEAPDAGEMAEARDESTPRATDESPTMVARRTSRGDSTSPPRMRGQAQRMGDDDDDAPRMRRPVPITDSF